MSEEKTTMEQVEYMTKTEYASDVAGVVKQARQAEVATISNDSLKLGAKPATDYAQVSTVNALIGLVGTAQDTANSARNTADAAQAGLMGKVEKEAGKSLSSNDYTNAEKAKLAGVEDGANNYAVGGVFLRKLHDDGTSPSTTAFMNVGFYENDEKKQVGNYATYDGGPYAVRILKPGIYFASAFVETGGGEASVNQLAIMQNGGTMANFRAIQALPTQGRISVSTAMYCEANDLIYLKLLSKATTIYQCSRFCVVKL